MILILVNVNITNVEHSSNFLNKHVLIKGVYKNLGTRVLNYKFKLHIHLKFIYLLFLIKIYVFNIYYRDKGLKYHGSFRSGALVRQKFFLDQNCHGSSREVSIFPRKYHFCHGSFP